MFSRQLLLIVVFCSLFVSACSSKKSPVIQNYSHPDHGEVQVLKSDNFTMTLLEKQDDTFRPVLFSMKEREEMRKEGISIPSLETLGLDSITSQPILFIVSPPQWDTKPLKPNKPEEMDDILFSVRERTYRYLLRSYPHPVRVRYAYSRQDPLLMNYRVLRIVTRITSWTSGWNLARYTIGFGLGSASIKIEGEIHEGHSGENLLAKFTLNASHGGYAQNGLNTKVLKDSYVLKYAAERAIGAFAEKMPLMIPGVQTHPDAFSKTDVVKN